MTTDENQAASRRLYEEVFGHGNPAVADEIMDSACLNHGPGAQPMIGTDQIKRQAALLRTAIPDLETILNDQFASGDRVVSRWTGRGTNSGPLVAPTGTVPPTGRQISFDEIRIDRFEGGRIVESWFIPDRLTLWQQLGLIPTSEPR